MIDNGKQRYNREFSNITIHKVSYGYLIIYYVRKTSERWEKISKIFSTYKEAREALLNVGFKKPYKGLQSGQYRIKL